MPKRFHLTFSLTQQGNYGKQTLLWDVLFGTKRPRLESADEYVDFNYPVNIPWGVSGRKDVSWFPHKKDGKKE